MIWKQLLLKFALLVLYISKCIFLANDLLLERWYIFGNSWLGNLYFLDWVPGLANIVVNWLRAKTKTWNIFVFIEITALGNIVRYIWYVWVASLVYWDVSIFAFQCFAFIKKTFSQPTYLWVYLIFKFDQIILKRNYIFCVFILDNIIFLQFW